VGDITITPPARPSVTIGEPGTGTALTVEEEGTAVDTAVESINFVGAGVTATQASAGNVTVTISGGGGSSAAADITIADAANDFTATNVEDALAELQADAEADATALSDHIADTAGAHAASAVSADSTTLVGTGTDVQAVLEELDNGIADHLADGTAAHAASAISFTPNGSIAATDVQAAIQEVRDEAAGATDLAWDAATSKVTSNTGTDATLTAVDASNPGLMTVAQKSKLDGIESGASADQSASEIMAAVQTVDGTGSGLDADLLDGNHAAAFATSGHNHSGVYDPAGTAASAVSAHEADTTSVHGIADTSALLTSSSISDTAYNATTWDAVTTVAPSKNAVRDKIEALDTAKQAGPLTGDVTTSGAAATLATVYSGSSSVGSASAVPVLTIDGKGRITATSTASPTVADPPTVLIIARQTLR
jgi:hypothetical protein